MANSAATDNCATTQQDGRSDPEDGAANDMSVRLNPKTWKTGRLLLERKVKVPDERQHRVRYDAVQQTRRATGEISMKELMDSLDSERLSPHSTLNRLAVLGIRFNKFCSRKPKFKLQRSPILNEDAYYLLPPRLLSACLEIIPLSNKP